MMNEFIKITGVLMAAGYSERMGQNKLLMDIQGKKMIEHVMDQAMSSKLDRLVVVTAHDEIMHLAGDRGLTVIINPSPQKGQSVSVVLGADAAADSDGVMYLAGDMPYLTTPTIDRLIAESREHPGCNIVPFYRGQRGNPVIFPKVMLTELMKLTGDTGGRQLLKQNLCPMIRVDIKNPKEGRDLDTLEDLKNENQ